MHQGLALETQERWQAALDSFDRAIARSAPRSAEGLADAYSHVGHCLIELGRGTEAQAAIEKALAVDANNWNAHLRAAQLYLAADLPERANAHIAYVAALHPQEPEMLLVRASFYSARKLNDLAEQDLIGAYHHDRTRERAAEKLAELYVSEERLDRARNILMDAASHGPHPSKALLTLARIEETEGQNSKAESDYRKAVALEDSPESNARLAQFLARTGDVAGAEEVLRKIERRNPGSTAAADLDLNAGRAEAAMRDYEFACAGDKPREAKLTARLIETDLAWAAQGYPARLEDAERRLRIPDTELDEAARWLLKSEVELAKDDLPQAKLAAAKALQLSPDSPAAMFLLGNIAERAGEHSSALEYWRASLDRDSTYHPARLRLADASVHAGDGSGAEEYVVDVVREEPANLEALLLYSRALLLQREYESAGAIARRALSVAPHNAEVAVLLGDIALDQHQLAMALLQYEKAMLLDPYSQPAMAGLTAVYQSGKLDGRMLRKLETLAETAPPSSRMMEIVGRLYAFRGQQKDAERCLRRAVAMDPKRPSATLSLAQLYSRTSASDAVDLLSKPDLSGLPQAASASAAALMAGLRAEDAGHIHEAINFYEQAVRTGDRSGVASNNLACIYAKRHENLDRAAILAQHALQVNPGNPQVLDTVGMVGVATRHFTQAIAAFQSGARRASELNGTDELQHTILAHLAEAQQLAGQPATER